MAAYMALVKLGPRNLKLLLEEARQGQNTAGILQLIGDLGDPAAIGELEAFCSSDDPRVAEAATESIALLREVSETGS
jgi:HEAT repeat protein